MDTYENLRCLSCQENIVEGQDIAIPITYKAPDEEPQEMIVCVCWFCSNEMNVKANKEAIEAIICARVTRLRNDDDEKSYKP